MVRRSSAADGLDIVHSNTLFDVARKRYRKSYYYMVKKPDVVTIIPIFDDGMILLEREFRPPVGKYVYNLPAGHLEEREAHAHAAKRELEEETGYAATKVTNFAVIYESPGVLMGKAYLYFATGLKKGKKHLDINESISVMKISLGQAKQMIKTGRIVDAKTIVAILYYSAFISK